MSRAFKITTERRGRIAADFRAKLVAELGEVNPTASRGALVELAISAYTQATELSAAFLAGRASPGQVAQMSIARGQLQRALRSLGVIDRDADAATPAEKLAAFQRELEEMPDDES